MTHSKKRIGSLETIEVPGAAGSGAIVCFHGFGANAEDLYPLHAHMNAPPGTHWFFPDGILELAPNMPAPAPRAWWPIDEAALQYALDRGTYRDLSGFAPPGMEAARTTAASMIRELIGRGFPLDRITLLGFSQGAMLATELTLRSRELFDQARPAGLAILSGTLLDEKNWSALAGDHEHFRGFQFFQSHGVRDPILGFEAARRLEQLLRAGDLTGEFVEFPGGHEIPPQVVARLGQYLTRF
ncbi:MAG: esterase [Leptospirales bacterium]|jgi:phospholipase/carboxylesterase